MLGPAVAALAYVVIISDEAVARRVYYISKAACAALPIVWLWVVGLKPQWPRLGRGGWGAGVGFGLLVSAAMLALYFGLLRGHIDGTALREKFAVFGDASQYIPFAAFLCLANSAFEEYYWRWFVFGRLAERLKPAAAILLSGVAFSLHHLIVLLVYFQPWPLAGALAGGVAVGGFVWAWLYHRYGSLYSPWVSHIVVDVAAMIIGYDLLFG
jgi:membrane protease YdiL (CAAX protease family)